MITTGIINATLNIIDRAESITRDGLREGRIETEPAFTDRFIGSVESGLEFNNTIPSGYRIRARTLRDRGPKAPENEFGADFISIFDVNISGYKLSKGFMVQAKPSDKDGIRMINQENNPYPLVQIRGNNGRLKSQCEKMLEISQASFVFIYDTRGVHVVPATTIVSIENDQTWHGVYSKSLRNFYQEHLMCFVGDLKLDAHDDKTLRNMREETKAQSALLIQVSENPQ